MRKKITVLFILMICILTLVFSWIIRDSLLDSMIIKAEENLISELKLSKKFMENKKELGDIQVIADEISQTSNLRVTVVDMEGVVIAETDENPDVMDNHLNRKEILEAIKTQNPSISIRYSNTVQSDYLYAAVHFNYNNSDYILRIARPLTELQEIDSQIKTYIFYSIGTALLFIIILIIFVTKKITEPIYSLTNAAEEIKKGNYGKKIYNKNKSNDEISLLTNTFNQMSIKLEDSIKKINQKNLELKTILNNTINGIIAVDKNHNILFINKISLEILEIPYDYALEGEAIHKIIRNKEIIEIVDDAILKGSSQTKELNYIHLDKILQIYVNPVINENNEITGSIIILYDVTNLRKLEKMRSDFVSNVSHELKTPLTSIKGFIEILKGGAVHDREKAEKFLDIIDLESDRLYRLINDILRLSEIESLDKDYNIEEINLNNIVKNVYKMLENKIQDKEINFHVDYDEDLYMKANEDRIKQLLINLIDNAVKYTEQGEIKVELKSLDNYNKITISDTGIGFEGKHKERLFERFYRIDEGRSRDIGGTGLGLAIVKHIVLLYNGKIKVESDLGKGTKFEIFFPKEK